ncbi:MAG TPA: hypothetical protein VNT31_01405 [Nocardioides sp.]|nr:hypothetical protein [Nocardioides sp.]
MRRAIEHGHSASEARRLAQAALDALGAPEREPTPITDLLPQPKRRRRSA